MSKITGIHGPQVWMVYSVLIDGENQLAVSPFAIWVVEDNKIVLYDKAWDDSRIAKAEEIEGYLGYTNREPFETQDQALLRCESEFYQEFLQATVTPHEVN